MVRRKKERRRGRGRGRVVNYIVVGDKKQASRDALPVNRGAGEEEGKMEWVKEENIGVKQIVRLE